GTFSFRIEDGRLEVSDTDTPQPDLILTLPDPRVLLLWLQDSTEPGKKVESPPLTDLVMEGTMWLNRAEIETITRLDRIPRSLRRDKII
ncbi:MAG: hypothetical protein D6736_05020, partial [Nitrospinota bacterium]